MRLSAIALCMMPALASAQTDETNSLRELMEKADDVQANMSDEARAAGVSRKDCLDAADPELGEIMFPDNPEAYQAVIEQACSAFQ